MGFASSLIVVFKNNRRLAKERNSLFEESKNQLSGISDKSFNEEGFEPVSSYEKELIKKKSKAAITKHKRSELTKTLISFAVTLIVIFFIIRMMGLL